MFAFGQQLLGHVRWFGPAASLKAYNQTSAQLVRVLGHTDNTVDMAYQHVPLQNALPMVATGC